MEDEAMGGVQGGVEVVGGVHDRDPAGRLLLQHGGDAGPSLGV
ncbi:hypothetical protein [Nonomuraea sp. NPDC003214]